MTDARPKTTIAYAADDSRPASRLVECPKCLRRWFGSGTHGLHWRGGVLVDCQFQQVKEENRG